MKAVGGWFPPLTAVVKHQETFAVSAFPATSFAPEEPALTVAV